MRLARAKRRITREISPSWGEMMKMMAQLMDMERRLATRRGGMSGTDWRLEMSERAELRIDEVAISSRKSLSKVGSLARTRDSRL